MQTSKNQQDFPAAKPTPLNGARLFEDAPPSNGERALLGADISAGAGNAPPSASQLRARLRPPEREESQPPPALLPPRAPAHSIPAPEKRKRRGWGPAKLAAAFFVGGMIGTLIYSLAENAHAQRAAPDTSKAESPVATLVQPATQALEAAPAAQASATATASETDSAAANDDPEEITPAPSRARRLDERALLRTARAQLRAGEPFSAQATLQYLQRRFPHGKWAQERAVLSIEVQRVVGAKVTAKRAARAFADAHPNSRYVGRLKPLLLE